MRRLFPMQWPSPRPAGHHRAGSFGQSGSAQPREASPAGSFPAEPGGHSRWVGYRSESPRGGSNDPVPDAGPGATASLSQSAARARRGAATAVKSATLAIIRFYRACLSPALPSSCRFYPSCSAYGYEAVEKWGLRRGLSLTFRRLLRCRPFGGQGYDPVP